MFQTQSSDNSKLTIQTYISELDEKLNIINKTHPYQLVLTDMTNNSDNIFYLNENMVDELYQFLQKFNKEKDNITNQPYLLTEKIITENSPEELKKMLNLNQNTLFKNCLIISRNRIQQCKDSNHDIKPIKLEIPIIYNNDDINKTLVDAYYCKDCNLYFILDDAYKHISQQGVILCQHMTWEEYKIYLKNIQEKYNGYNDKSLIRKYGYTTSQSSNLTKYQRQSILSYIIETEPIDENNTKWDKDMIIWFLQEQIKSHPHHEHAIMKWKEDLEYLKDYTHYNPIVYKIKNIVNK